MIDTNVGSKRDIIIKCADTYSSSTGLPLTLINQHGDILYQTGAEGCLICRKASSIMKERLNCRQAHLYGSYQAERFGGKYVFFCKLGLTHWVSPVVLDDDEKGALVAGPVLMVSPDDFLLEDILLQHLDPGQVDELKSAMAFIPVVSPERVDQLSNMLYILSAYSSGEGVLYLSHSRDILEQQADISQHIHYLKTMGGQEQTVAIYPVEKEKELITLIVTGEKKGAQKILNEILGAILLKSGVSFDFVKARVLELVVVLSRAALEGGADIEQIFGLNYQYLNEINQFVSIEEMTVWLSKIMNRFTDCVFDIQDVKHADVIYKALDYIKNNYIRKISLEDVASHVFLSPSYFSRIFKEETGKNFVSYLNDYRIRVSKRLLLDESIALVEISSMVGYEDQSYFSKSFKKLVGTTPGKYREAWGKLPTK